MQGLKYWVATCLVAGASVCWSASDQQPSLSMSVFNRLTVVERLVAQEQYGQAAKRLDALLGKLPDHAVDKAYLFQSAGNLALIQQRFDDARRYFRQCDQQQALPDVAAAQVLYTLANLSLQIEDYRAAAGYLDRYMNTVKTEQIRLSVYQAMGTAQFQLKRYDQAVFWLQTAQTRFPPNKSISSLLFASYYENQQKTRALSVMESMVKHWPDVSRYWLQLANLYLEQSRLSDALQMLELAWYHGYEGDAETDTKQILQFVHVLYDYDVPDKAAAVLEQAIEKQRVAKSYAHMSLLAALYSDARNAGDAIEALSIAAEMSDSGQDHLYLAQLQADQDQPELALQHARKALERGLDHPGQAHLLMAGIYHKRDDKPRLKAALQAASGDRKTASSARAWLTVIE